MDEFNYVDLQILAGQVSDVEAVRIAMANRYQSLISTDVPGGRGRSVDDAVVVKPLRVLNTEILTVETRAIRLLEKYMRNGPWGPWLASEYSRGVGPKQLARLLGSTGDPYWHNAENRPRRVSELWAYCGFHVVEGIAPRRQRGVRSNWSDDARTRARLIAESCIKQRQGQYRAVYDRVRAHYADAVHLKDCIRCGPSGNPAKAGTPVSAGHQHARALRAVSKEVLRDLWIFARKNIHDVPDGVNEFGDMENESSKS